MKKAILLIAVLIFFGSVIRPMYSNVHAFTGTVDAHSGEPGSWNKYSGNPVITATQAWENVVWHSFVMKDGLTYKMWYTAWSQASDTSLIGYATSNDGITWHKYQGNPILTPGSASEWDGKVVGEPFVMKDGDTYKMWYRGESNGIVSQIGYATSSDGISWTKHGDNPVLSNGTLGSWDEGETRLPSVLYKDGTYKMWYTGTSSVGINAIGYATSPDGLTWTPYVSNPILSNTSGFIGNSVHFDGSIYRMWYGTDRINYATSANGIEWETYSNNPILEPGSPGEWDDHNIFFPTVFLDGPTYKMWYAGSNMDGSIAVGYASATELNTLYLPLIILN